MSNQIGWIQSGFTSQGFHISPEGWLTSGSQHCGFAVSNSHELRRSTLNHDGQRISFDGWRDVLQSDHVKHEMTRKRGDRTAVLRARVPQTLKDRVAQIASGRGADESDVVREAVIRLVESTRPQPQQEVAA